MRKRAPWLDVVDARSEASADMGAGRETMHVIPISHYPTEVDMLEDKSWHIMYIFSVHTMEDVLVFNTSLHVLLGTCASEDLLAFQCVAARMIALTRGAHRDLL